MADNCSGSASFVFVKQVLPTLQATMSKQLVCNEFVHGGALPERGP